MNVHLTLYSRNKKTGPIPVTTSPASTCPDTCPFNGAGCYAQNYPMHYHWQAVDKGTRGGSWGQLCENVARFQRGQLWRHNQAGDLPGDGAAIDPGMFLELVRANEGRRGFTYTHYPMTENNQVLVYLAKAAGFTLSLSSDNLSHADTLAALGIAPVVVALPDYHEGATVTPEGRLVIICPAHENDQISCFNCGLCYRQERPIIGFPAHGNRKHLVTAITEEQTP